MNAVQIHINQESDVSYDPCKTNLHLCGGYAVTLRCQSRPQSRKINIHIYCRTQHSAIARHVLRRSGTRYAVSGPGSKHVCRFLSDLQPGRQPRYSSCFSIHAASTRSSCELLSHVIYATWDRYTPLRTLSNSNMALSRESGRLCRVYLSQVTFCILFPCYGRSRKL